MTERSPDGTPSDPMSQGPGVVLRSMREAQQLTLAQASLRLKYSVRQLEALEDERWEALPEGVPLRGLVKNYGRYLGADTDGLMAMLETRVPSAKPGGMAPPVAALAGVEPTPESRGSLGWGWLLAIVLLLGAAGFYGLQQGWVPESWLIFDWMRALGK